MFTLFQSYPFTELLVSRTHKALIGATLTEQKNWMENAMWQRLLDENNTESFGSNPAIITYWTLKKSGLGK